MYLPVTTYHLLKAETAGAVVLEEGTLSYRIMKLAMKTREAHQKLCCLDVLCPAFQGQFSATGKLSLPDSSEVNFSTSAHHLPPADTQEYERFIQVDTEDESTVTTRWLTEYGNDGGHSDGRYRSPRGLRSKVSNTAQMLSATSTRALTRVASFKSSPILNDKESTFPSNQNGLDYFRARADQLAFQLRFKKSTASSPQSAPPRIYKRTARGGVHLEPLPQTGRSAPDQLGSSLGINRPKRAVEGDRVRRKPPKGRGDPSSRSPPSGICAVS